MAGLEGTSHLSLVWLAGHVQLHLGTCGLVNHWTSLCKSTLSHASLQGCLTQCLHDLCIVLFILLPLLLCFCLSVILQRHFSTLAAEDQCCINVRKYKCDLCEIDFITICTCVLFWRLVVFHLFSLPSYPCAQSVMQAGINKHSSAHLGRDVSVGGLFCVSGVDMVLKCQLW